MSRDFSSDFFPKVSCLCQPEKQRKNPWKIFPGSPRYDAKHWAFEKTKNTPSIVGCSNRDTSLRVLFIMTFSSQWETNPYKNSKLISLFLHSDFSLITTPGYIRSETFRSMLKKVFFFYLIFFFYFENIIFKPSAYFTFGEFF